MGYRSEVCLAVDKAANSVLEAIDNITNYALLGDAEERVVCKYDGTVKYYWSCVKWYEGYPAVDMIMNTIHKLPEESYGFIRIGEDTEDLEERGSPYEFDMFITRSISY